MYVIKEDHNACLYCGAEVISGEEVYETDDGFVHEECFCDYCRQFAKQAGWMQYAYAPPKP